MDLFRKMLEYDSTSGKEREFALMLASELECGELRSFEVGDGSLNLLLCWGEPRVVFCTHMDTVPPYLPPRFLEDRVLGRGSCDAKGQIYAMYKALPPPRSDGEGRFRTPVAERGGDRFLRGQSLCKDLVQSALPRSG